MSNFEPTFKLLAQDFDVNDELRAMIALKMEHMIDLAPNDSEVVLKIKKHQKNFEGQLHISTLTTSFDSVGQDADAYTLVKALCRDVREQIHSWKKHRFYTEDQIGKAV